MTRTQPTERPHKLKLGMLLLMPLALSFTLAACSLDATSVSEGADMTAMEPDQRQPIETEQADLSTARSAVQNAAWANNVDVAVNQAQVTISSDGLPNHERLNYYLFGGRAVEDPSNAYNVSFTLPLDPEYTGSATPTGPGAIGIAVSGAVFFNPYEGDQATFALEANNVQNGVPFIDACNGHPEPNRGTYHYHGIPYCITDEIDSEGAHSVILGYLADGFPIYGPQDTTGDEPTNLDQCNGHFGVTPEFPDGTYHYHTTEAQPYVPECYMGEAAQNGRPGGGAGPPSGGPPPGGGRPPAN